CSLERAIFNPRPCGPKESKMRYVMQVALSCAMSLGLVAAALAQNTERSRLLQPPAQAAQPGAQPSAPDLQSGPSAPTTLDQKYINPAPETLRSRDQMHRGRPQDSVINTTSTQPPAQSTTSMSGQARGELGVWMVATPSQQGVEIQRITQGS